MVSLGNGNSNSEPKTYNHFLHLLAHAHSLGDLDVLHARQDLVLDGKTSFHAERGSLLDCEWFVLERLKSARACQVNDDVWATFGL